MNVGIQNLRTEVQDINADAMDECKKNDEDSGEEDKLQIEVNKMLMKTLEAVL